MKCLRRVRSRHGRCYELCGRIMLEEPGAESFMLVHGRFCEGRGHAWIELSDGRIYDSTIRGRGGIINPEFFDDMYHAERCYTKAEAVRLMAETKTSGPWTEREEQEWLAGLSRSD